MKNGKLTWNVLFSGSSTRNTIIHEKKKQFKRLRKWEWKSERESGVWERWDLDPWELGAGWGHPGKPPPFGCLFQFHFHCVFCFCLMLHCYRQQRKFWERERLSVCLCERERERVSVSVSEWGLRSRLKI